MQAGYVGVETHSDRPGLARLTLDDEAPDTRLRTQAGPRMRFVARFSDGDAALMH